MVVFKNIQFLKNSRGLSPLRKIIQDQPRPAPEVKFSKQKLQLVFIGQIVSS